MRARHLALAVATAALLLTGCGGHADTSNTTAPSSSATDLAHLQKMVDGAESAASSAESDMAKD
ncbi:MULTISPECIES: hypothetical protein [unclassified Streptomyces]|uniref:hypothetical protein n=1 Tax=unclassified Streptomyces TaxID=2593676 RepID=UPI002E2644D0